MAVADLLLCLKVRAGHSLCGFLAQQLPVPRATVTNAKVQAVAGAEWTGIGEAHNRREMEGGKWWEQSEPTTPCGGLLPLVGLDRFRYVTSSY